LACAAFAGAILITYLVRRPPFDVRTKLSLFFGLAVFPALSGLSGTVAGIETTGEREFCGSCHVMQLHYRDSSDPKSQSLAARHARNPYFGDRNCYVCHADYGMFGFPVTKLNGMRHVYEYYIGGYRAMTLEQAIPKIHLYKPYDNNNCRQCHSGTLANWNRLPDHVSLKPELGKNQVSCVSAGCHGYAHPFSKPKSEARVGRGAHGASTAEGTPAKSAAVATEASPTNEIPASASSAHAVAP
jgi:cytochrome c-type protein NapC